MTGAAETPKAGTPLWLKITVSVSLALNLLIVGMIIGSVAGRDRDGPDRLRGARDLAPPPFLLALEPEDRRALVGDFQEASRPYKEDRKALRRDIEALLAELRSDEFDPGVVDRILSELRGRAMARQKAGADVLGAYLAAMSPDERRAYADRLEKALRRVARRN